MITSSIRFNLVLFGSLNRDFCFHRKIGPVGHFKSTELQQDKLII